MTGAPAQLLAVPRDARETLRAPLARRGALISADPLWESNSRPTDEELARIGLDQRSVVRRGVLQAVSDSRAGWLVMEVDQRRIGTQQRGE